MGNEPARPVHRPLDVLSPLHVAFDHQRSRGQLRKLAIGDRLRPALRLRDRGFQYAALGIGRERGLLVRDVAVYDLIRRLSGKLEGIHRCRALDNGLAETARRRDDNDIRLRPCRVEAVGDTTGMSGDHPLEGDRHQTLRRRQPVAPSVDHHVVVVEAGDNAPVSGKGIFRRHSENGLVETGEAGLPILAQGAAANREEGIGGVSSELVEPLPDLPRELFRQWGVLDSPTQRTKVFARIVGRGRVDAGALQKLPAGIRRNHETVGNPTTEASLDLTQPGHLVADHLGQLHVDLVERNDEVGLRHDQAGVDCRAHLRRDRPHLVEELRVVPPRDDLQVVHDLVHRLFEVSRQGPEVLRVEDIFATQHFSGLCHQLQNPVVTIEESPKALQPLANHGGLVVRSERAEDFREQGHGLSSGVIPRFRASATRSKSINLCRGG